MTSATHFPAEGLAAERIVLRAAHEEHATELLKYYEVNRQHLRPWEPLRPASFFEPDAITGRLRVMAHQTSAGNALHLLMFEREGDRVIGECNFTNIVRGPFQACHLGFSVASMFEGRGLMREGLSAAIDHVFTGLRLHRIMANYRPENVRSERLLTRLGFEKEGVARSFLMINGSWADHVLTSRISPLTPSPFQPHE
jgi:ribosomal-protein-alanine N-acetyltransferase